MSHKKRNYRKRDLVEDEGETSAPVKISDDPSGSLSRLSFADEEVPKQTAKPKRPKETSSAATATTAATEQSIEPASIASQQDDPIVLLKCAKKKLSVRRLPDRGRGVCAEEDISAGQTLLEEDSYAAVVDDNNLSRRCSGCFGEAKKLSRCSACKVVHYCSSVCQKRDWVTSHQEECKAFVKVGRPVPTAIRVVSRILRRRQRDRESYSEVENLENRKLDFPLPQLQTFAQIAMVVRDCVTEAAMPSASETIDLWCRFTTNSFSILDGEMVDVGVGVYPATAMINHSCWPNCVVVFEGARILVRSIRPIKRGEEITQSYIDIAEPVSRRRADLRQRYFFLCQCELCERTSKDMDPREALNCPTRDCKGAIPPPDPLDMSDLYETACRTCGNIVNLDADDIRDTLRRADKYSEFAKDLESQDPTRALQNLHHSLRILKPLLHFSHATLLHTQQHLKDLCTQLRDWPAAYGHACALLDGYRVVYPCNHPLVGVLALATARMLLTCGDEIEVAIELLREVVMVMEVAFGAESAMTRRAREEEVEVTREFERKKLGRG